MKRNLANLTNREFDVLIIGAGIQGVSAAWDAALRGLSVALVDKDDFCSGTSANSQKTIHGGLRYLQNADIRRMRESIRERMLLMRIAPHLVHPLSCIMPTYGHLMKGREAMFVGMGLNDIISFDRNQLEDPEKIIPRCRVLSKNEVIKLIPGLYEKGLTGAALWHDAQAYNTERLALAFVQSAVKAGAEVANYVKVTGFLQDKNRVQGVKAQDMLTGDDLEIRAKIVVNNAGAWVNDILAQSNNIRNSHLTSLSSAICLVTNRQLVPEYGVGISGNTQMNGTTDSNKESRAYFITPWRGYSLIGTFYKPFKGKAVNYKISEKELDFCIKDYNRNFPGAPIKREDVSFFYGGLMPMNGVNRKTGEVKIGRHYRLIDHNKTDKLDGLVSVIGVKYTTGRDVARKTIDLVLAKLGKKIKCQTDTTPLQGGEIKLFNPFLDKALAKNSKMDADVVRQLVFNYGSDYGHVLDYVDKKPSLNQKFNSCSNVIKAEVVHAVKEEMALKLVDVVLRRTELGSANNPGDKALTECAELMAEELNWDKKRLQQEIDEAKEVYIPIAG